VAVVASWALAGALDSSALSLTVPAIDFE